jgi:hypothetical protein
MARDGATQNRVHLVGSVGLDSVDEVYRTAGRLLGRRLKRIPDGEVGGRRLWVSWQYPLLRASPYLMPDPGGAFRKTSKFPLLCMADGVTAQEIRFGELGYAREARISYVDFVAARERGDLPSDIRFQVCLPTPMGVIYAFCIERDVRQVEAVYERAMIAEIEEICRRIPHDDLCIQWDVCHEMIILDGQPQDQFPLVGASLDEIIARFERISAPVPDDVELGFHLCYGDFGGKHIIEPKDASVLVEVANRTARSVAHPIAYVHMPVPVDRSDDDYFRPLEDLDLDGDTELYLGIVHAADGVAGVAKRAEVAGRYAKRFGIAAECGIARARTPELVTEILEIHAESVGEP